MNATLAAFATLRALDLPRRLTRVSAWKEHIPFAFDLVGALRPETLVELGTHAGDSYCAFCQGVAELDLPTRCYAVDTWKGDDQAGHYGPEVLADLRRHHDPLYGRFSTLLQSTFDEARAGFPDRSVDLLHIDGFHTYQAVRADLEAWLPKLSDSGVVLLHDTSVRERDFGVWRVWEEQSRRYPSFEFLHGHGLGVLAVGPSVPAALRPLLESSGAERDELRTFYARLGERTALIAKAEALAEELRATQRDATELTAHLQVAQVKELGAAEQLAAVRAEASELARLLEAARASEAELTGQVTSAGEAARATEEELRRTQARLAEEAATALAAARERDELRARLAGLESSLSASRIWRLASRWWALRDGLRRR